MTFLANLLTMHPLEQFEAAISANYPIFSFIGFSPDIVQTELIESVIFAP